MILTCFYMASPSPCHAVTDTITQGQELEDWKTLISKSGIYTLGFFRPGSAEDRFVGVWYTARPRHRIWTGNRESPIGNSSATLVLDGDGKLRITYKGGQPIVISSYPSV